MKQFLISTALSLCLFSSVAHADLSEALTAFKINRYDQAFNEFSYLSDEGNSIAHYYLGKMYAQGLGVSKDPQKAIEYYKKAEKAYNIDATYELAQILLSEATEKDDPSFQMGLDYLKRAAYAGQSDALLQLGEMSEAGELIEQDYKNSFGFYLMSALRGNARAQYKLASQYFAGVGTPQDYENALKWLSRSARQGYVLAQKNLAEVRINTPALKNLPDAYAWYSIIAAYNGEDEIGQEARKLRNKLGAQIKKPEILIQQQRRAREWRPTPPEKSVPASDLLLIPTPIIPGFNDAEAIQTMLAQGEVLLTDGRKYSVSPDMILNASITKNFSDIEKAINKAASKGQADAYAYYGDLLRTRFQNDVAAVDWYKKGADEGHAYSQYQLAKAYCEGKGVDAPRPSQCYAWLLIANKNSADTLKLTIQNAITAVELEITPEEKIQGEKIVQEHQEKSKKIKNKSNMLLDLF